MPDGAEAYRWTTPGLSGARTSRGLTGTEIQELDVLRAMMRRDVWMTEAERRRWFELSQRHDLMRG
jgi:hypothetical protein